MPDVKMFRAIYGCAKEFGLDNELIHQIVEAQFGVDSLKKLTDQQCRKLLDGIRTDYGKQRQHAGHSGWKGTVRGEAMGTEGGRNERPSKAAHLVNARELAMLAEAAAIRGWSRETLDTFIQRQLRRRPMRTMRDFNKVFWALKAMNRRERYSQAQYDQLTAAAAARGIGPADLQQIAVETLPGGMVTIDDLCHVLAAVNRNARTQTAA